MKRIAPALFAATLAAVPLAAATFTVVNTNDSGAGSLRQALLDAETNGGLDTVAFAIPGSDPGCDAGGVCTIALTTTQYAQLFDPIVIDGYTQPGSSPNTDPVADDAVLRIVLNGAGVAPGIGLRLAGGGSTVRGLVINGFSSTGIGLNSEDGDVVEGNFLGTDASGTTAVPNGSFGIDIAAGNGHTVGGLTAASRNIISGNGSTGIRVATNSNITISGNFIGTAKDGVSPLGNGYNGVGFQFAGATGTGNLVGGRAPGAGNVIAYNIADGVLVQPAMRNIAIVGNSIHDNAYLGIDFSCCEPIANDPSDSDDGANHLQNFPIVQSVVYGGSTTEVVGKLDGAPTTAFDLDFYANPACSNSPREYIEGQTYLGTFPVTTDATGHAPFDAVLPIAAENGARISVTATDPAGNTSEFSQRILFKMIASRSGPPAGGTAITISGTDFAGPATMTVGGVATPVTIVSSQSLTSTSPTLPPGTVNDIVLTTADGTTGTLVKAWVANFLDVPNAHQFYAFVTTLVSNGITAGVGSGLYGVADGTKRQQMAVFLMKAKYGLCYAPPPCAGVFTDVPCSLVFAPWIEALAAQGITTGCGVGIFCPDNLVTRRQMAVFLLKTKYGSNYVPPDCTGVFDDVVCPTAPAVNFIEQLAAEQITGGCQASPPLYCPDGSSTRGQMAVFITKTFGLQ